MDYTKHPEASLQAAPFRIFGSRLASKTRVKTSDSDDKSANIGDEMAAIVGYAGERRDRGPLSALAGNRCGVVPLTRLRDGGKRALIYVIHKRYGLQRKTVGADNGYLGESFLTEPFKWRIKFHVASRTTGRRLCISELDR
jgi:hypothetical protein